MKKTIFTAVALIFVMFQPLAQQLIPDQETLFEEKINRLTDLNEDRVDALREASFSSRGGGDIGDPPESRWIEQLGKHEQDKIVDMARDDEGNMYICGYFSGEMEIAGTEYTSSGLSNGFILKIDANGIFQWFKQVETDSEKTSIVNSVVAGDQGNISIGGHYVGSGLLNGEDLTNLIGLNAFVAQINKDGDLKYVTTIDEMPYDNNSVTNISMNDDGEAYAIVHGETSGTYRASAIFKINSVGELMYDQIFEGPVSVEVVEAAENGYYVNGLLRGPVEIDNLIPDPNGYQDIVTMKFNADHQLQWASIPKGPMFSSESQFGKIADIDSAGNVYFTGNTRNMVVFGPDTVQHDPTNGTYTQFMVKCNGSGVYEWAVEIDYEAMGMDVKDEIITFGNQAIHFYDQMGNYVASYDHSSPIHTVVDGSGAEYWTGGRNISDLIVQARSAQQTEWSFQTAGTFDNASVYEMRSDEKGNLYTLGFVIGKMDYFQYEGTDTQFLAKHGPDGNMKWFVELPEGLKFDAFSSLNRQMALSPDGEHIYLTGRFEDQIEFGDEFLVPETEGFSQGSENVFILNFNANGALEWSQNQTTTAGMASIAAGKDLIFIGGVFQDSLTVEGNDLISRGQSDIYISCFDLDGQFQWIRTAGGKGMEYSAFPGADDMNNVYIGAEVTSKEDVVFIDSSLTAEQPDGHIYLAKLNSQGELQWLHRYGEDLNVPFENQNYFTWPIDVYTTAEGYTYMKGWHGNDVTIGNKILSNKPFRYGFGLFSAKFNPAGQPLWVHSIQRKLFTTGFNEIDVDNQGNLYMGTTVIDSTIIDGTVYEPEEEDLILMKYGNDGSLQWLKCMDGYGVNALQSICAWDTSAIFIAGYTNDRLYIDDRLLATATNTGFVSMLGNSPVTAMNQATSISFSVRPNPADERLLVEFPQSSAYQIRLIDQNGKQLHRQEVEKRRAELQLGHLLPGVYFLTIDDGNRMGTRKIIVK